MATERWIVPTARMSILFYLLPVAAYSVFIQRPCAAGYYCASSGQAIPCPLNSYCAENVTVPAPCPPGQVTPSLGATSQDACVGSPAQIALRGSYNTTSGCSIHIEGWCSFTDAQKNGIIAGFVLLYGVLLCICCCCKAMEKWEAAEEE